MPEKKSKTFDTITDQLWASLEDKEQLSHSLNVYYDKTFKEIEAEKQWIPAIKAKEGRPHKCRKCRTKKCRRHGSPDYSRAGDWDAALRDGHL